MIRFVFPIEPQAQGRPRGRMRSGKGKTFLQFYDMKASRKFKEELATMAKAKMAGRNPVDGPLVVNLKFYITPPGYISSSIKNMAKVGLGIIRPEKKPDLDNYIKGTLDALNKIVWYDDSRIVRLTAEKFYSGEPRLEMEVLKYTNDLICV